MISAAAEIISAGEKIISAAAERKSGVAEMFSAAAERKSGVAEMFSAVAERKSGVAEMFSAVAERKSGIAEMFSGVAEMISAIPENISAPPHQPKISLTTSFISSFKSSFVSGWNRKPALFSSKVKFFVIFCRKTTYIYEGTRLFSAVNPTSNIYFGGKNTMPDIISNAGDAELINLAAQFYTVISANLAEYGLSTTQATALATTTAALDTSLQTHIAAQASARNARQAKDADRDTLEQLLRSYLRIIKAVPGITDAQIAALGIPASGSSEPAQTATRPTATIDTSERLRHTIDFRDEAAPNIKRRPAGAIGCEIFIKIGGAPPVDDKECDFLTLDTNTPYVVVFNGADAGKPAHYMLRWRLKDGVSPWSATITATITG